MAKRRGNKVTSFSALPWEMLNSPAYIELPYSAAKALPYFIGKVKGKLDDPERFKTEFSFSYKEGNRYGFAPGTFSKVIQALVSHGLIDPIDKGGMRSDCKSFNKFSLSLRWKNYGKPEFEMLNWKCFTPRIRPKATSKKETYRFKKENEKAEKTVTASRNEAVGVFSS
ncbi:MAG: hypothetical protein OEW04_11530 [Nitrospirota bacterium]|nr:hypothetical protein [Nitrospirota bacterium]